MQTKYIFLDIDGTLFDHNTPKVPDSTKLAIKKAKENGHKVFICTGRSYRDIPLKIKEIAVDGYIYGVGAHIVIDKQTVFKNCFPIPLALKTFEYLIENDLGFKIDCVDAIHAFLESGHNFIQYMLDTDEEEVIEKTSHLLNHHYYLNESIIDLVRHDEFEYLKITAFDKDKTKMDKILSKLTNDFDYYISPLANTGIYFSELKLKDVSKANGIKRVLEYYHADKKDSLAIGDSLNDLDMIEYVNTGIAMGNGCKALKEKADYITANLEDDGIYQAFKHFKLI